MRFGQAGVRQPIGIARRTVHFTEISQQAVRHYHREHTEVYCDLRV